MIRTFRHKGLRKLFEKDNHRKVPAQLAERIRRQLDALDAAKIVQDMNLPGFGLHALKGNRKGTWAIRVSENWIITFFFKVGEAHDVDLEDYH